MPWQTAPIHSTKKPSSILPLSNKLTLFPFSWDRKRKSTCNVTEISSAVRWPLARRLVLGTLTYQRRERKEQTVQRGREEIARAGEVKRRALLPSLPPRVVFSRGWFRAELHIILVLVVACWRKRRTFAALWDKHILGPRLSPSIN